MRAFLFYLPYFDLTKSFSKPLNALPPLVTGVSQARKGWLLLWLNA